ncbi:MAG: MMPL family transporter [Candidatus Polarisedimenticolaceae bacterium]|nr:MMPL family transporter [Candidatus Polarisedimenticolaceae bacterium]
MQERFFQSILKYRYFVLIVSIALTAALGNGLSLLQFNNDYRMFFSEDNPQLQAFEQLQNTYANNDNVLFIVTPKNGKVFSREALVAIEALTKEAWQTPFSLRVDSITNYQHTYADGDDLIVEDLIFNAERLSEAQFAQAEKIATQEPLLLHRLISPDASVTGINITIQLPGKALDEVPIIAASVRQLAADMEAKHPAIEIRLTGIVMMNASFPEASQNDMQTLYPLMLLVILVTLYLMLRSIPGTFSTLLVIILTIIGTMGLTGYAGIKLSPPTVTVPIIIMTLAIADCVHILVNYLHKLHQGLERQAAMLESLRINLGPIFITSLTTAIGFLSMNFAEIPPFRDLGNMSAMGVMLAFFLSITLLPAMMMMLPVRSFKGDNSGSQTMLRLADFVICNRKWLMISMTAIILALIAMIPRNELNDEFVKYFDESITFRQHTDYATEHLTGIYLIEYSLDSGEPGGVSDPAYLAKVEAFAEWYRQQPRIMHVNTITDIMKRLNKNLHGDDEAWYKLPDQRDLAAQYLLLYEFSLPFGLDLNNQINVKKSATRFTVTMESVSSQEMLNMEERAQAWLAANAPEIQSDGTGSSIMFAHIGSRNIVASLEGAVIALILISGILVIALRSLRIGLLSLLPNLIPIGVAFGIWGLLVGQVGMALSVVTGMTLGIVVDDTVHFLSKYLRARREQGLNSEDAVRYAFTTVGMALVVTSLVLILGFGILAMSHFQLNSGMGQLTAIVIVVALVADFLLLPPVIMRFGESKNEK